MQIDVEALVGDAHAEWGESRENWRNGYRIGTGTPAAARSRCASRSCTEAARSCSGVTNVTTRRSSGPRRGSRGPARSGSRPGRILDPRASASWQRRLGPVHHSPWTGCANSIPSTCSTNAPSPVWAGPARYA